MNNGKNRRTAPGTQNQVLRPEWDTGIRKDIPPLKTFGF